MTVPARASHDLFLCYGSMGNCPLPERAAAAAAAGFDGLTLGMRDMAALRTRDFSDAAAVAADHGLRVGEVDAVVNWVPNLVRPPSAPAWADEFLAVDAGELMDFASAAGARAVTLCEVLANPQPIEQTAEAFADICDRASELGLDVTLEFISWSGIANLATAVAVVEMAARPNGGITLDSWQLHTAGEGADDVRRLPADVVACVQVADVWPDRIDRADRALPGQGIADLVGFLDALDELGCRVPIGVEVFNADFDLLPAVDVARRLHDSMTSLLSASGRKP